MSKKQQIAKLVDIAREAGMDDETIDIFVDYVNCRFGHCPANDDRIDMYLREWAQRFADGREYLCSDLGGQRLLREMAPDRYGEKDVSE